MNNTQNSNSTNLFAKKETLQNAVRQLKSEFVGIDAVIDQIADTIVSWLYFPELQDKPIVINLWGMTGIGKTSLIKRFTELLNFEDRYFHFDLGENRRRGLHNDFKEIEENCSGKPFIIALDEFQFARTINEKGWEVGNIDFWDLLDSGKLEMLDFNRYVADLRKAIDLLGFALQKKVIVNNGIVESNLKDFNKVIKKIEDLGIYSGRYSNDEDSKDKDGNTYFIPGGLLSGIINFIEDDDKQQVFFDDIREQFDKMDGRQTINHLEQLYKNDMKPKIVDCSKSLIFVMGNLDEVYSMTKNFSPDINADNFYEASKKITITQVKNALLTRFRSEQIARLGNNHIIYPAFNEDAFYRIIKLELDKIKKKMLDIYNLKIIFDAQIEKLIYSEGVYPTQGTRPVFTTVYQIINARLGKVLYEIFLSGCKPDTLEFTISEEKSDESNVAIVVNFMKNSEIIHTITEYIPVVLKKLRHPQQNDLQAIIAVHESGHSVVSIILQKIIPESITSVTANFSSGGFTSIKNLTEYSSRKGIINDIAMGLGGIIAERMIFGEDNITQGAVSDIQNATTAAYKAVYDWGMSGELVAFGNQNFENKPVVYDTGCKGVNMKIKELMEQSKEIAEGILEKQKQLLLHLADYLSDNRYIDKEGIKEFIAKYAVDFDMSEIIEDGELLYYRNKLKELVS
ncbi:MAG: hypothetical protein LBO69_05170 [Ignavibacteria bacterium]|jgi:cell division protease FtsH|nr:hypothetical protein [Ignavibacteria bacterium]